MASDRNIGRVLEGKYELTRVLGTGGMGTVYEAMHLLIRRRLAVKLLHKEYAEEPQFAERFKREARAASAIGHAHIVDVTDMGTTDDGALFLVMEFLNGADLATLLQKQPRLPARRVCHIMIQVLSALEAAHAKGIVHRDLKPANIFIVDHADTGDYVKLVDFGISKMRQDRADMSRGLTKTGELLGTPSFMSPEQARGDSSIDGRSDIFSVAVILYRMLTGALPFEDKVLTLLLMKILEASPPHPCDGNPNIPRRLGDAVAKAMAKNPADRFESAAAFRRELQRFSPDTPSKSGLQVTQYLETAPSLLHDPNRYSEATPFQLVVSDRQQKRRRRGAMVLSGTMLFLLLAVAVAYSLMVRRDAGAPVIAPVATARPAESPPIGARTDESPHEGPLPEPKRTIQLRIDASPPLSRVFIDGREIGVGKAEHSAPADSDRHVLTVTAPGYATYQKGITFDRDRTMVIHLAKDLEHATPTLHPAAPTAPPRPQQARASQPPLPRAPEAVAQGEQAADPGGDAESADAPDAPASGAPPGDQGDGDTAHQGAPLFDADPSQATGRRLRHIDEINPW